MNAGFLNREDDFEQYDKDVKELGDALFWKTLLDLGEGELAFKIAKKGLDI